MKILVLTFNLGKTSSGKATERIIDGLFIKGHQIQVICGRNYTLYKKYTVHEVNPKPLSPSRLFKVIGNMLKREVNYAFWEWRATKVALKVVAEFKPDLLYSRGSPISSMSIGNNLKAKTQIPHFIHFADPIPPTLDWMDNLNEREKLLRTINPIIDNSNASFFVTEQMKTYQHQVLNKVGEIKNAFVTPNPIEPYKVLGQPINSKFIFTYLGTFSEQRNPKLITTAFINFALNKSNVEFHVYGNEVNRKLFKKLGIEHPKIKIYGPTENVTKVIAKSNVLIDVDAKVENPVFISGKLMEYLSFDRLVLLISPKNSPSRELLSNLNSSVLCANVSIEDIQYKLEELYTHRVNANTFNDRLILSKKMSIGTIIEDLETNIENILNDY